MKTVVLFLPFFFGLAVSFAKPDSSWFNSPKISKIKSPNLEQMKTESKQHDSHHVMQANRKKLKTITDVINETLDMKTHLHDSLNDKVKARKKKDLVFKRVGCYADDKSNRALPELLQDLQLSIDWNNMNKTIKFCAKLAKKAGYKVFSLQKFGSCYSGKDALHTYDKYGTSKECINGVGRDGANFVYLFKLPVVPMKRPTVYCFPKTSRVEIHGNHVVAMGDLKIGDRVKTLDSLGNPIYSDVIAFLHRQEQAEAEYLSLVMENGRVLQLSSKHLVFRVDNITDSISPVYASAIKVGDALKTGSNHQSYVTGISVTTQVGVYAPLTRHGTMIVDGVLVSCYAHWYSHTVAHLSMAPLRMWTDITSLLTSFSDLFPSNLSSRNEFQGMHWYAESLMSIVQKFVPMN